MRGKVRRGRGGGEVVVAVRAVAVVGVRQVSVAVVALREVTMVLA